jgi:amino acid transporter
MDDPGPRGRRLTLLPLAAATFFIVSGGPYGLEDVIYGRGYAESVALLLLVPLVWSLPVALMVGELASSLPATGGYYVWVRRALGPFLGLQEAWLSLAVTIFDLAIYPVLLVAYLGRIVPGLSRLDLGSPGWMVAMGMIALCFLWNALGIRAVGVGSEWVAAVVLAPFVLAVALAAAGLLSGGAERLRAVFSAAPAADPAAWNVGLVACMWNTMGWDNASTFAAEVAEPQQSYPRAMLLSVALVVACYLLPVLAAATTGLAPAEWAAGSWVEVGRRLGGPALAGLVVAGGAVTVVGMFNAIFLSWSRLPVALAEGGWLPERFARRSPRSGAPLIALGTGAILCGLCVGLGLRRLLEIDVLLYGASLVLELAALLALRLREPGLSRPFRIPGGVPAVLLVAILPTALLAFAAWGARGEPAALGLTAGEMALLVAAVGPLWWLAGRRAPGPILD